MHGKHVNNKVTTSEGVLMQSRFQFSSCPAVQMKHSIPNTQKVAAAF